MSRHSRRASPSASQTEVPPVARHNGTPTKDKDWLRQISVTTVPVERGGEGGKNLGDFPPWLCLRLQHTRRAQTTEIYPFRPQWLRRTHTTPRNAFSRAALCVYMGSRCFRSLPNKRADTPEALALLPPPPPREARLLCSLEWRRLLHCSATLATAE